MDDLLAYAESTHDIVVFHNKLKTNKIKFKFDSQLSLSNSSPMTTRISDFNEDGMEDIALLSTLKGGKSYIAFAGKKGKFKKSDFEDITPYLNGLDLSVEQHTVNLWTNPSTGERQVLRMNNATGGIDEEGNATTDEEEVKNFASSSQYANLSNTSESNNAEAEECNHLTYTPVSKRIIYTCGFNDQGDTQTSNLSPTDNEYLTLQQDGNQDKNILSSLSSFPAPAWAKAVLKTSDDITISWASVSGASYYNREVSLNGSSWRNEKKYNHPQTSVIFYDQQVRTYKYRIRACASTSNCSGWVETGTISVTSAPVAPATPSSAPSVSGGSYHPVNSFFNVSVNAVSGATRYEIYVGTSSTNVSANKSGSGRSYNIWSGGSYGYRYIKYKACNGSACSGLSPWKRVYVYTVPGAANNVSLSKSSTTVGSSANLTWTRAGGIISSGHYEVYETKPGQSASKIATINAGSSSSYSHPISPYNVPGSYTYGVKACNPNVGCGSTRSASITLNNRSPDAINKSQNIHELSSKSINLVSGNSDPDGHGISLKSVTQPSIGSVSCTGGNCTYTVGYVSSQRNDTYTYTIEDSYGATSTGTVTMTVLNSIIEPQPEIIDVKNAAFGVLLTVQTDGTLSVDKKIGNGPYVSSGVQIEQYNKNGITYNKVTDNISSDTDGISYRLISCFSSGCSAATYSNTIDFSVYDRDVGDDNANGIRNDVENHIDFLAVDGSIENKALLLYARYLSRIVNSNSEPSGDMMIAFANMSEAYNCIKDESKLIDVKSMILDSEEAYYRYNEASNAFARSIYAGRKISPECGTTSSNVTAENFPESFFSQNDVQNWLTQNESYTKTTSNETSSVGTQTNSSSSDLLPFVVYVNGMLTKYDKAESNRGHIQTLFDEYWGSRYVIVSLGYNSFDSVYQDIIQAYRQIVNVPNTEQGYFDMVRDIALFEAGIPTKFISIGDLAAAIAPFEYTAIRKEEDLAEVREAVNWGIRYGSVVMLSHSQGNFYANELWEEFNTLNAGSANSFLRVYGLGSPASHVAGNGHYKTNVGDIIVEAIRALPLPEPARANVSIQSDDPSGHGLKETYLIKGATHTEDVIAKILTYFDEMGIEPGDTTPPQTGRCVPLYESRNSGSNESFLYDPSPDNDFSDNLFIYVNADSLSNGFSIFDERGVTLFSTNGKISGTQTAAISYDADRNGVLDIFVTNEWHFWEVRISCP